MSHRFPRLRFFQHNPSGPTFVRAVVDHVVITGTALGFVGDTALLFATAYNAKGVVIPGVSVDWSSSQPGMISVIAGLCTFLVPGTATITATVDGRAYTTSATAAAALTPTLDFAPLIRRSDLADPLILVSNTGRTGYQDGVPQHTGSNLLGLARASYPKSNSDWGFVTPSDGPMGSSFAPDATHLTSGVTIDGPYPNTAASSLVPNDAAQHYVALDNRWLALATADNQDAATFKRSLACVLIAATPADVGKTVRVNLIDNATYPAGGNWNSATQPVIKFVDVVLQHSLAEIDHTAATANLWRHIALTFDSQAQQSAVVGQPQIVITMVPNSGILVSYAVAPYPARGWQDEGDADPYNWLRPMPFHAQLGVPSDDIYCNTWSGDSDLPTLFAGAARASTAVAAPDSGRYFGGRTLSQYTLGVGDGITTAATVRIEEGGDAPPTLTNTPTASAWVHWYVEPAAGHVLPLDTDLAAYLIAIGATTLGEDTVQRADNLSSPGVMDTGQAWNPLVGTWVVSSHILGLLNNTANALCVYDWAVSDCTVDATVANAAGNGVAVTFRLTNTSNYWQVEWESGTLFLNKFVAGAFVPVLSTAMALANGDRIGVVLSGNSISPTHNGTIVGALVTTDAFNATATQHGLGASANASQTSFSHFKVTGSSGPVHTYGPVALERDSTRYGMSFGGPLVKANGGQFFRARFNINQASEGYLDFTPKIVNASSGPLVLNAYRAAVTTEGSRGRGLHSAWVPKRTIAGRQFGDSRFETIPNIQTIMTTPTLLWLMRQVLPWSPGDLENLNGAGTGGYDPSLWQSGPYGSADYTFHCDVQPNFDGTFSILIQVGRGSPTVNPETFMSWNININRMSIAEAATAWQKFVAFDMAVVALNGVPQAFGIGLGTGTSIQWLNNGDTFLGGTVQYQHSAGTAWAFDGGLGTGAGLGHIGLAADLDRVRQTNGWVQAIFAANTVPSNTAGLQRSIELQISKKWGARLDHRVAA